MFKSILTIAVVVSIMPLMLQTCGHLGVKKLALPLSVPKFTLTFTLCRKFKNRMRTYVQCGGGNPLYNMSWEIPCNVQHKNNFVIIKIKLN
jgi:hypothetical protein